MAHHNGFILTWLHLQRSDIQIRSHSEVLGVKISTCLFRGHNSTHRRWVQKYRLLDVCDCFTFLKRPKRHAVYSWLVPANTAPVPAYRAQRGGFKKTPAAWTCSLQIQYDSWAKISAPLMKLWKGEKCNRSCLWKTWGSSGGIRCLWWWPIIIGAIFRLFHYRKWYHVCTGLNMFIFLNMFLSPLLLLSKTRTREKESLFWVHRLATWVFQAGNWYF